MMARLRSAVAIAAIAGVVAACSGASTGTPGVTARPSEPTSKPGPSIHGHEILGGASISYGSFREWASYWAGVAIVRVVSVGPIGWNTVDGLRPSEEALHASLDGVSGADYTIGRAYRVSLDSLLSGTWLTGDGLGTYWRPGGIAFPDRMGSIDSLDVPDPVVGELAVAFLLQEEVDFQGAGLRVSVGQLFPVDDRGRVATPPTADGSKEVITLDNIATLLP